MSPGESVPTESMENMLCPGIYQIPAVKAASHRPSPAASVLSRFSTMPATIEGMPSGAREFTDLGQFQNPLSGFRAIRSAVSPTDITLIVIRWRSEAPDSEHIAPEVAASTTLEAAASVQCVPGREPWDENKPNLVPTTCGRELLP